jgi:hypothetical protein
MVSINMETKYSLNEQTYLFIQKFEKGVVSGKTYSSQELVDLFEASPFTKEQFNTYKKTKTNSMWYALTRSGHWEMVKRGTYRKK